MDWGEAGMRWTVRLALLAAAARFACRPGSANARKFWTAGWLLMVVHIAAAFAVRHHWSHAEAARHVEERTLAEVGVASSVGIWLNYLFVLLWTADVVRPLSPRVQTWWLSFWWFMSVNAAIVFERGPTRWVGVAVAAALAALAFRRRRAA